MKHLDLFSGYGGFTLPAHEMGWETIGFSEIDKYASAVLAYNFPGVKNYGDVSEIDFRQFNGKVDLITGGTPCQDLSVAGKQAGLDGARSGLFFEFIRAITESEPKYFIWENVKGSLSSSQGWDMARVQIEMAKAGYSIEWRVLNATEFSIPQNRERIFILGTRGEGGREVLPKPEGAGEALKELTTGLYAVRPSGDVDKRKYRLKDEAGTLSSNPTSDNLPMVTAIDLCESDPKITDEVRTIQARYHKGYSNRKAETSGVLETRAVITPDREVMGQNGRRFKDPEEPSFILTGQDRHGVMSNMRIRRLTPTECERLMGLEDGEKCSIVRLWQKETKSSPISKIGANVEISNGKVARPVGNVGKTGSQENVLSAEKSLLSKSRDTKKPVVLNVQVNSEKNSIKIWQGDNEEELLLSVSGVEKKRKFPSQSQVVDFVQMVVGLNTILWRETHNGRVESQVREQPLILQKNGVPVLNMYGRNTMPLVKDVEKDLITLNQHLKFIISLGSKIENYEQDIQTLFSSAIPVITGFIPTKIEIESISEIKLSVLSGWTSKGIIDGQEIEISDTQRYKMCGNGVVTNVVRAIYQNFPSSI